jgi:amidase
MARSALDLALMLQAIAGPTALAPLRQPIEHRNFVAAVRNGPLPGLRVAYCPDIAGIGIDPGVESVCRGAVDRLAAQGAQVDLIDFDLSAGRDAFLALRGHWFAAWMSERLERLDGFGVNVRNNTRAGINAIGKDLGQAETVRGRIWHQFHEFFTRYDHLLTPTMAVSPFPVEQNYPETVAGKTMRTYVDWLAPTFVLSLTGLPVASVPCGLDTAGMPVGLQVVGPPEGEEAVLAFAQVLQDLHPIGRPAIAGSATPS